MPLRLIDPNCPQPWVHPQDRDENGLPVPGAMVFHIVVLTEGQSRKIQNLFVGKTAAEQLANAMLGSVFMECVKRIDNVQFPGEDKPRSISGIEDKRQFLDCIPAQYMTPIYVAIQNINGLDAGTVKNYGASSVSPLS